MNRGATVVNDQSRLGAEGRIGTRNRSAIEPRSSAGAATTPVLFSVGINTGLCASSYTASWELGRTQAFARERQDSLDVRG